MAEQCVDRVVIVTGASRGIGQAAAVRFAAEGANVAVLGRGDAQRNTELAGTLGETVTMIRDAGGAEPLVIAADIAAPDFDRHALVRQVGEHFGAAPDVLVHSAAAPREFGGGKPPVPFAETPRERFQQAVDLNVWAWWDLSAAMVPGMRERGAGWILAISSNQATPRPRPTTEQPPNRLGGACIYGGTKAFIDRIATGAAQELWVDNIAVNTLAPTGPVRTPLSSTVVADPPGGWEPMETMVEAALALCTGDPKVLTSRVAYSLPLLAELGREVRTIDGRSVFDGWKASDDPRAAHVGYLAALGH